MAVVLLLGPLCLRAQEPTIAVDVKVANLRDKHGQIISNLSKDDFVLQEEETERQPALLIHRSPANRLTAVSTETIVQKICACLRP